MLKKIICIVILNVCVAFLCCSCSKEYDSYEYIDKMYDLEQHEEYQIDFDTAVAIGANYLYSRFEVWDLNRESYYLYVDEYNDCYSVGMMPKADMLDGSIAIDITKNGKFYGPHW